MAAATVSLLLGAASCSGPLSGSVPGRAEEDAGNAELTVRLGGISTQTILPDVDMEPVRYRLLGSGPGDETFEVETASETAEVNNLRAGSWELEARGLNAEGFLVAQGTSTVDLDAGTRTTVSMSAKPVDGTGSLLVSARWEAGHTVSSGVVATLVDRYGHETELEIPVVEPGRAEETFDMVPSGYHHLIVQLMDSGQAVAGAGETVRVVADATTEARLDLEDLNKVGEAVAVTAAEFTVAWDPPEEADTVDAYRVYARPRGEYEWEPVAEVAASAEPSLTVDESLLDYGVWEIAVSALSEDSESEKHTSMDDDAEPSTGWYVDWQEG
ncbi:MAG: fibronectin type III domain-containing protein [Spirochaetaceae bacterium]